VKHVNGVQVAVELAQRLSSELAEYSHGYEPSAGQPQGPQDEQQLPPEDALLVEYDRRILDPDLRLATRSRFVSTHYADAVEAGVKALNECVRTRLGRSEDGDALMTVAFSPNNALLRINKLRSKSDESAQRGHMFLCQGVVGAWRNPRAHSLIDDSPARTLMMLETIDELIRVTKTATRTRKPKSK
jgi:uncharacterized protein (TIGR02391 family)